MVALWCNGVMKRCPHLINGQEVEGPDFVEVVNPYSGESLAQASVGGWREMDSALEASAQAFKSFRKTSPKERQSLLRAIAAKFRDNESMLIDLATKEIGKPTAYSRAEVARLSLTFDLAADLLDNPQEIELPIAFDARSPGYTCSYRRCPVGVILAVTPYNWPYNLAAHKIAPALAAGNTVLLKPSPLSPLSSLTMAHLMNEAGCPPGVVNAVNCGGPETERAALDPRCAMVSFTGSDVVGWHLKSLLPTKKVALELGGDAMAVIMSDADLDWAAKRTVLGKFGYAGQICISVQHALIHESVYDETRDRIVAETEACRYGDPEADGTICGPLINAAAADRVMSWIDDAQSGGGRVLTGGRREGLVVTPTVMEDVASGAKLSCQEVFGPVLNLRKVSDWDEAVQAVNSSAFGLQTGVFSRDPEVQEAAIQDLNVGGVVINDMPTFRFDNMPYGGVKRSGFGREGVLFAYEEMTELKAVIRRG